jgi:hypothetical protein
VNVILRFFCSSRILETSVNLILKILLLLSYTRSVSECDTKILLLLSYTRNVSEFDTEDSSAPFIYLKRL